MGVNDKGFSAVRHRQRPGLIALIVLAHLAALYALSRALAPDFTAEVESTVVSTFTVTAPQEPPPSEPASDEGAQGDPGRRATPRPVAAHTPNLPRPQDTPLPRGTSTGSKTSPD